MVRSTGIALLAARPAPPLSMPSFAVYFYVLISRIGKAFCSRKTAPTLNSCRIFVLYQTNEHPQGVLVCLVRSTGIEGVSADTDCLYFQGVRCLFPHLFPKFFSRYRLNFIFPVRENKENYLIICLYYFSANLLEKFSCLFQFVGIITTHGNLKSFLDKYLQTEEFYEIQSTNL